MYLTANLLAEMVVMSPRERVPVLFPVVVTVGTVNFLTLVMNNETHSSHSPTEYAHAPGCDLSRQI